MNQYKYTAEKLYEATDNGLQIIHKYLPDSIGCEKNKSKHFKYHCEKTPSTGLFKGDTCWFVKNYATGEAFSPIQIFQRETGITDYYESLEFLFSEFNVPVNNTYYQPNVTFKDKGDKADDYFFIKVKKKVERPQCFSAFVTAELCQRYNVYEVEYFERVTSESKKLMRVNSTEQYPIFCYSDDLKTWAKTYCPAEKKREITNEDGTKKTQNYKHGYLGKKPQKYYHGVDYIKSKMDESSLTRIEELFTVMKNPNLTPTEKDIYRAELDVLQLPYVVICSGGSDGLTIASLSEDFYPVWGNSENDIIDYETYCFLKKVAKRLVYLPDVDSSGVDFAYKYSKAYWKLPIVFLPKYYLGDKGKDFRDYVSYFTKKEISKSFIASEFKKLLYVPVSFEFVTIEGKKYRINHSNLEYFLNAHNYFVCSEPIYKHLDNEDKGKLVHFEGYKVTVPQAQDVRNFCVDYYVRKGTNTKVVELIKTCNALRGADLKKIPKKDFDFTRHGKDFQLFFFQNMCVKVTAKGVESVKNKDIQNFVYEDNIKPREVRLSNEQYFEYYKDDQGRNRVDILTQECDFMNFLINGSRVHWKKEAKNNKDFRKITLNSPFLSEDEQITQEQHFLGKCFAIGYLLHKYNVSDFAKFVYVIDDEEKSGYLEASGGSGKSLMMTGVQQMIKFFEKGGKSDDLLSDNHVFGSLTEADDLVYFDDMNSNLDFTKLYPLITRGFFINPKGKDGYFLPFEKSPKLAGTFNYALRNTEQSTLRRILFVTFSSYYHAQSKEYDEWQPTDDFHNRFYTEWNMAKWNLFYNFMFRCLQLYLQNRGNELLSPTDNVTKNTLKAVIGDSFLEWIEDYLQEEKFNTYLTREEVYQAYLSDMSQYKLTKPSFKKKLIKYCELKGYELNPKWAEGYIEKDKRIMKYILGKTQECFYIHKKDAKIPSNQTATPPQIEQTQSKNETDTNLDIPF